MKYPQRQTNYSSKFNETLNILLYTKKKVENHIRNYQMIKLYIVPVLIECIVVKCFFEYKNKTWRKL